MYKAPWGTADLICQESSSSGKRLAPTCRVILVICTLLAITLLTVQQACIRLVPGESYEGEEIKVPIEIEGDADIGSIYFELVYSNRMLQAVGVEKGSIDPDAIFEYSIDAHDRVIIGCIDSSGIDGEVTMATISFQILRTDKEDLPIKVENILARSASVMTPLEVEVSEGSINTAEKSFESPVLRISTVGGK